VSFLAGVVWGWLPASTHNAFVDSSRHVGSWIAACFFAALVLLLTLIPRSSPPSTAGRALAMSAGAFLGGFALIACGVAWALGRLRVPY
jgi:hypothetical protein